MAKENPLKDKIVLAVDDEPDVLETIEEELDMVLLHKATDYDTAIQYLLSYTYDVAITPEALKKSMKLGALSFLPKEKMSELLPFMEDIITNKGAPLWEKFFEKLGGYFNKRFGPDWKEKDRFFKEFEEEMKKNLQT
jgi:hypothetical protein